MYFPPNWWAFSKGFLAWILNVSQKRPGPLQIYWNKGCSRKFAYLSCQANRRKKKSNLTSQTSFFPHRMHTVHRVRGLVLYVCLFYLWGCSFTCTWPQTVTPLNGEEKLLSPPFYLMACLFQAKQNLPAPPPHIPAPPPTCKKNEMWPIWDLWCKNPMVLTWPSPSLFPSAKMIY